MNCLWKIERPTSLPDTILIRKKQRRTLTEILSQVGLLLLISETILLYSYVHHKISLSW
jgi:hypothetical protein